MSMVWLLVWFMQFFFFKQKTAYEMRISDWSSDVCSSDLLAARARPIEAGPGALSRAADAVVAPAKMTVVRVRVAQLCSFSQAAMQCRASVIFCPSVGIRVGWTKKRGSGAGSSRDRNSVGWGKRGTVRVDPGGRRVSNK